MSFAQVSAREHSCQSNSIAFKDMLHGDNAFYNQPDYTDKTSRDFVLNRPLPISYTWNTESKIIRIAKQIFSIIIFPVFIYKLLHSLVGKILLPASNPSTMGYSAHDKRLDVDLADDWKYKRFTIEVDGYKIDASIIGEESTLNNGRWVLVSNESGGYYEEKLCQVVGLKTILSEVQGNAIVFNYPGVGASTGLPNRQAMANAYRAMLSFLEDQTNGIGAKEIIGYGCSMGGAVQADALKFHEFKKDVKYVFVKSNTFSNLSTIVSTETNKLVGFLIKLLGWNMNSAESSKDLQAPEIIMQTANVMDYEEIKDSSKIIDNGLITAEASLAKELLENDNCSRKDKIFIGMREKHNRSLIDPSFLATKIETSLSNSRW